MSIIQDMYVAQEILIRHFLQKSRPLESILVLQNKHTFDVPSANFGPKEIRSVAMPQVNGQYLNAHCVFIKSWEMVVAETLRSMMLLI